MVAKASLLTVKMPKSTLKFFGLWMWRHFHTRPRSWLSALTVFGNSHASGFQTQITVNSGHYSQHRMDGRLSSMSWKYQGYFDIGPFACRRGNQSCCMTLSQCTMTSSITWMSWCECWPIRTRIGNKTCSLLWNYPRQKLSNYYSEVTTLIGRVRISAHIVNPFRRLR